MPNKSDIVVLSNLLIQLELIVVNRKKKSRIENLFLANCFIPDQTRSIKQNISKEGAENENT